MQPDGVRASWTTERLGSSWPIRVNGWDRAPTRRVCRLVREPSHSPRGSSAGSHTPRLRMVCSQLSRNLVPSHASAMAHACDARRSILRWSSSSSGTGIPCMPDAGIVQRDGAISFRPPLLRPCESGRRIRGFALRAPAHKRANVSPRNWNCKRDAGSCG
jgi:hypothetical protein